MFEFLRVQYALGRLSDAQLTRYVQAGCITSEEYRQIITKEEKLL